MYTAQTGVKQVVVRAVVHRANGRVEDQGIIASWHRNKVMRKLYEVGKWLRKHKI